MFHVKQPYDPIYLLEKPPFLRREGGATQRGRARNAMFHVKHGANRVSNDNT
jgi:hypothetical protein